MDIKEILEKLLSFDTSGEAIILGAILLITFLLGIFTLALLGYWPSRRQWRKEEKKLNEHLETLDKELKVLEEKNTVQSAKSKRLEEDAVKNELHLSEQKTKLAQIQQLYSFLEAERDAKHKIAEAAERELQELKNLFKINQVENLEVEEKLADATQDRDAALAKVEEIKGLLEEIEQDRHAATDELEQSAQVFSEAKRQLATTQVELEELKKELKITQDKLHIIASNDVEGLVQENMKLHGELIDLHAEIIRLQADKQALDEKLMAYKEADARVLEMPNNGVLNAEVLLENIENYTTIEKEETTAPTPEAIIETREEALEKLEEEIVEKLEPSTKEILATETPIAEKVQETMPEKPQGLEEEIISENLLEEVAEEQSAPFVQTIDNQTSSGLTQTQFALQAQEEEEDPWVRYAFKTTTEQAIAEEISRTLPLAKDGQKDDLKKINGIGLEIEKRLNNLGISTYEQIANLSDAILNNRIGLLLAAFDASIDRDQWVAQAKQLITKQKINNLTKDIKMTKLFRK